MKQNVSEGEFIDSFERMGRGNNFSTEGRRALYDYLTNLEEDTGQEIELDVIAICCDFNEYSDLDEFLKDYSTLDIKKEDYDNEEEFKNAIEEYLQDNTILIKLDNDLDNGFIIQGF